MKRRTVESQERRESGTEKMVVCVSVRARQVCVQENGNVEGCQKTQGGFDNYTLFRGKRREGMETNKKEGKKERSFLRRIG